MDKRKIKYIIRDAILGNLINDAYITSEKVMGWICEIMPEDNEDRDYVVNFVFDNTYYNYIVNDRGEGYILGLKEKDIKDFIAESSDLLTENDSCWLEYIRVQEDSGLKTYWSQLNKFVEAKNE